MDAILCPMVLINNAAIGVHDCKKAMREKTGMTFSWLMLKYLIISGSRIPGQVYMRPSDKNIIMNEANSTIQALQPLSNWEQSVGAVAGSSKDCLALSSSVTFIIYLEDKGD